MLFSLLSLMTLKINTGFKKILTILLLVVRFSLISPPVLILSGFSQFSDLTLQGSCPNLLSYAY